MSALKTYTDVLLNDATAARITEEGGNIESVCVALANQKQMLLERITALEAIAPKRITTPDGKEMVWHCLDELIPYAAP